MDTKLIAKILPTQKDGSRTIGTGYPIAKDLVITARHVVVFAERDNNKPILVEWEDFDFRDEVSEIIFDGGKDCDIAILKCRIPPEAHISPLVLATRSPKPHDYWASFGYPRLGKDEVLGGREKISALGKFHPCDESSHKISLTSESDALEKSDWKGISGAPVFQNRTLYAVISSTPKKRNECFTAVSIPWLLQRDEKFRELLNPQLAIPFDFSNAIKYLNSKRFLQVCLFDRITKENQSCNNDAQSLIDFLSKKPISELIQIVYELQQSHEDVLERKILAGFLRLLLPCIFDRSYIPFISNNKNPEARVVVLPYATDLSAEMLMAAFDKREACFRVLSNDNKLIARAGRYRLPVAPEAGAVSTEKNIADIDLDLKNRFGKNCNLGAMHIAMDKELFKITDEPSYSEFDTEEVQLLIQSELRRRDGKAPSYYWIFIFGKNEDENQRMKQFALELKRKYPEIVQLSLKRDVLLIKNERDLFFQLAETQEFY